MSLKNQSSKIRVAKPKAATFEVTQRKTTTEVGELRVEKKIPHFSLLASLPLTTCPLTTTIHYQPLNPQSCNLIPSTCPFLQQFTITPPNPQSFNPIPFPR